MNSFPWFLRKVSVTERRGFRIRETSQKCHNMSAMLTIGVSGGLENFKWIDSPCANSVDRVQPVSHIFEQIKPSFSKWQHFDPRFLLLSRLHPISSISHLKPFIIPHDPMVKCRLEASKITIFTCIYMPPKFKEEHHPFINLFIWFISICLKNPTLETFPSKLDWDTFGTFATLGHQGRPSSNGKCGCHHRGHLE